MMIDTFVIAFLCIVRKFAQSYSLGEELGSGAFSIVKKAIEKVSCQILYKLHNMFTDKILGKLAKK